MERVTETARDDGTMIVSLPSPDGSNEPQEMMDASTSDWIYQGFLEDVTSARMSHVQGRQFLVTGMKPVIGQRTELKLLLRRAVAEDTRLAGQVVRIGAEPEAGGMRPKENDTADAEGSAFVSSMLKHFLPSPPAAAAGEDGEEEDNNYGEGITFKRCTCPTPGCTEGSFYMSKERWERLLEDGPDEMKAVVGMIERVSAERSGGVRDGQRVVCEGRLNFDHDLRRGWDDGPWPDGIPLDGRDVYQWTLVCKHGAQNQWCLDRESLVNLGRDRHPRCWPWSNDSELPYERTGISRLDRNRQGQMMYHACIGPFGCPGDEDHTHNYGSAA